jgi:hypothetical protein
LAVVLLLQIIWSNAAMGHAAGNDGRLGSMSCALSGSQKTAMSGTLEAFNLTHCVRDHWSNITVAALFDGGV